MTEAIGVPEAVTLYISTRQACGTRDVDERSQTYLDALPI
jgi:hypothetical protein